MSSAGGVVLEGASSEVRGNTNHDMGFLRQRLQDMRSFTQLFPPEDLRDKDRVNQSLSKVASLEEEVANFRRVPTGRNEASNLRYMEKKLMVAGLFAIKGVKAVLLDIGTNSRKYGVRTNEYIALHRFMEGEKTHPKDFDQFLESFTDGHAAFRVGSDGSYNEQKYREWQEVIRYALEQKYTGGSAHRVPWILGNEQIKAHFGVIAELTPGALYVYAEVLARAPEYAYNANGFIRYWKAERSLRKIEAYLREKNASPIAMQAFKMVATLILRDAP